MESMGLGMSPTRGFHRHNNAAVRPALEGMATRFARGKEHLQQLAVFPATGKLAARSFPA